MKNRYLDGYPNIYYERNDENLGAIGNFKKIYSLMDTPFRSALTDDDQFTEQCIERQMDYLCLDEENRISIVSGYSGLCDAEGNFLGVFADMDKRFPNDIVAEGHAFADFMMKYNFTLFNVFAGVFRAERLAEPFGMMNSRQGICNLDRYSAYVLLSSGLGAYVSAMVSIGRQHPQQTQRERPVIMMAGNDYFHEVWSARKYGFLRNDEDRASALSAVRGYYDQFVLNSDTLGHIGEQHRDEMDLCLNNLRTLVKEQEKT
jgi:hypothetical protein